MLKTELNQTHKDLGAKMAEFAGYEMPIVYTSIIDEHEAVRNNAGLFDVSHMGEFIVRGREALMLVQHVISNDASKLSSGQAQYAYLPNDEGGVVDDLLVYRLFDDMCAEGEQAFMLVVNASNIEKDWNWIQSKNTFDCKMINISEDTCLLALQGPKALDILSKLSDENLDITYYNFIKGEVLGVPNVLISATGYTGSGGFELYFRKEHSLFIWEAIMKEGKDLGLLPCGLGARDTLRLEKGFCLYGHEIDDQTSPLEAGLGWVTKLNKEEDFPSKEILKAEKSAGLARKLVGIKMDEKRVPRQGYPIVDQEGNQIGIITSGTHSPTLDSPIGLGFISTAHLSAGADIFVRFGKKDLKGSIVPIPFV